METKKKNKIEYWNEKFDELEPYCSCLKKERLVICYEKKQVKQFIKELIKGKLETDRVLLEVRKILGTKKDYPITDRAKELIKLLKKG